MGAQIPTKIPCNSSPVINKYSETHIMIAHKASSKMLVTPNFLTNFIIGFYLIRMYKKFVIYSQFIAEIKSILSIIFVKKIAMLKAVLFDMDGVIVDTEPLHHKAYQMMFEEVGIEVSETMYRSFTGQSTRGICEFLCKHFNLVHKPIVLEHSKRAHFTKLFFEDPDLQLLECVEALIKDYHANGLTLVVASSASMFTINNVMKRFNLDPYFKDKLSGADLKASKPHPEIFENAAKAAGVSPSECFVIEDSTNGIIAAKEAGIFCIAYKSEHSKDQDYYKSRYVSI